MKLQTLVLNHLQYCLEKTYINEAAHVVNISILAKEKYMPYLPIYLLCSKSYGDTDYLLKFNQNLKIKNLTAVCL